MSVHTVTTESDLDRILDRHAIALLDFWAPWCAPCVEFFPIYENASARHPESAFCRVNTAQAKELTKSFGVESIPTLLVIRDRIMIAEQPGYLPEDALENLVCQVKALDMDAVRREMDEVGSPEEQAT